MTPPKRPSLQLLFIALLGIVVWYVPARAQGTDMATTSTLARIRFDVEVPAGTGDVYITGNHPELGNWNPRALVLSGEGTTRTLELALPRGTELEFKFTLGGWDREALDAEGRTPPNNKATVGDGKAVSIAIPKFREGREDFYKTIDQAGIVGRVEIHRAVKSTSSILPRDVVVWLPPEYDTSPGRFGVLYMHDGQNLFDPRQSTTGVDWGIDEAIVRLAKAGEIKPVIVVGVLCTDDRRNEYSPWGKGPEYAKFLVSELKPMIDAKYRTLADRDHTTVMGSSMGGLISLYLAWKHPDVFSAAGCLSTHFPWENGRIIDEIDKAKDFPRNVRVYFDYGSEGIDSLYKPYQARMSKVLQYQGIREGTDFVVYDLPGEDHNEAAWRKRVDVPLKFMLGR